MNTTVFGSPRSYHAVSPLEAVHSWADFLSTLAPVQLPLTRAEYAALGADGRKAAKRTRYFVAARFPSDGAPAARRIDKATGLSLVCLDVDDPQHARTVLARPLPTLPSPHLVYHTTSSTPEAPRLRVVVPAPEGAHVRSYPQLVSALAQALGLPSVTPESLVAVQPMYYPARFLGDDLMGYDPVVSSLASGPAFDFAAFSGQTGVQVAPRLQIGHEVDPADALQFLAAPLDGVTLVDAEQVLAHIDPDLPRDKWVKVMCALQHQFPGDPEALGLFTLWSSKGAKFPGDEAVAKEWNTRKPNADGRRSFTFRSLLRMAQEAGYRVDQSPMAFRAFTDLLAWVKDPARTSADLWETTLRKIAALPHRGAMEEDTLLQALTAALTRLGLPASKVALKKSLKALRQTEDKREDHEAEKKSQLPNWAKGFCYVRQADEFYSVETGTSYNCRIFDRIFAHVFCSPGESRPSDNPSDYLLNAAFVPKPEDYIYLPSSTERFTRNPMRGDDLLFVNTYRPTFPESDLDGAARAGELIHAHLEHLIAEPEHRRTLLDWMAYQVQNPGEKVRWAVVLQGAQGCGKTVLASILEAALGKGNVRSVSGKNVVASPYNEWMEGAQVIALEEIRVSGHNRTEIMNALKPAITNKTLSINQKFRDVREAYNVANYLLLTNHVDALAVDDGDRRYFILQSQLQTREQVVAAFPKGYFEQLFGFIEESPGAVRAFLESHPVSTSFPINGPAPATRYARRMAEVTASPVARAVQEALKTGDPRVSRHLCSLTALRSIVAQDNDLGDDRASDKRLTLALAELGLHKCGRIRVGEQRVVLWSATLPEDTTEGLLEAYNEALQAAELMGLSSVGGAL